MGLIEGKYGTVAFMFETGFPRMPTGHAVRIEARRDNRTDCRWEPKRHFDGTPEGGWS